MWSSVVVVEPSDVSVVTISSTISSVLELTVLTVKVELLFVVPVTVIKSLTAKPLSVVLVEEILYFRRRIQPSPKIVSQYCPQGSSRALHRGVLF